MQGQGGGRDRSDKPARGCGDTIWAPHTTLFLCSPWLAFRMTLGRSSGQYAVGVFLCRSMQIGNAPCQ